MRRRYRPRFLVPEVVQTSAMDCGPAALNCLLGGFGIRASYGRLREACQTDVDGTSIDTLEELANQFGLIAEQIMMPVDHVLLPNSRSLPAITVLLQPNGTTHFVVAWRSHGPVVQLMDPASGRRWVRRSRFLQDLYVHRMKIPAKDWRRWAASEPFVEGLVIRSEASGVARRTSERLIQVALADDEWRAIAAFDAAVRMTATLARSGAFAGSFETTRTLEALFERACSCADDDVIPQSYWAVSATERAGAFPELLAEGAVLVCVRDVRHDFDPSRTAENLSLDLGAVLREAPARPYRHLMNLLTADGVLLPGALAAAMFVATAGVIVEAMLLRSAIDIGDRLTTTGQRIGALSALFLLAGVLLALEMPIVAAILGLGRRLEARLRMVFLEKIPRLGDRYFSSRPSSDMAERSHSTHVVRQLPDLGGQLLRAVFELVATGLAITVLFPGSASLAWTGVLAALIPALIAQPVTAERDLRCRVHTGALARFYLDALLGSVTIRAHRAERAIRREHEALLTQWVRAGRSLVYSVVWIKAFQMVAGFGVATLLLAQRVTLGEEGGTLLLLAFWALNLPFLGQEIAQIVSQYPMQRSITLRLLEPLGAPDETANRQASDARPTSGWTGTTSGVEIQFRNVGAKVGGQQVLHNIDANVPSGSHVAIVGVSGAGKSSLVGVLLGWHAPAQGDVLIDGGPLDRTTLDALRRQTAWVDPAVWLWNRSLLENIEYGWLPEAPISAASVIAEADLRSVVERLPTGLQTPLGDAGTLVSGGEGQRVRFARALGWDAARLVLLDEPFRGLERERRKKLLLSARHKWSSATVLCVTHDMTEAMTFDRVMVLDRGRLVEYAAPERLASDGASHFRRLLAADAEVRCRFAGEEWSSRWLDKGQIRHERTTQEQR